ncbi:hypothetical protein G7074_21105 [Pedobacter sp. HDW13]|uniref:hypothetical protein n=1 Tax=Pedobacter sp. HDW13 TaxID=2714940 RepID=UPI001408E352|nr:hypothetical protein [Pedobacter sp. HDW13]QIL41541.1 hypothetical protein G7074_21105 [Pedobacter sp. HDW13]
MKLTLSTLISYDWEVERYANLNQMLANRKTESAKLENYSKEYLRIRKQLIKQFGKADEQPKFLNDEGTKYLNQDTLWESEEVHANLNMIFCASTQRIRLTLYWKK